MTKLMKSDWVHAGSRRLAADGIDSVRIEGLARDLGVTKGSFYGYFDDREALFDAMLTSWEERGTASIIDAVDSSDKPDPEARFRLLVAEVFNHPDNDALEVGFRAWARHHEHAREVVSRVDGKRVAYVSDLLAATGIPRTTADLRSAMLYRALVGDFTMHAAGSERMGTAALGELVELVLAPVTAS